ncbi:uncharacterized protein GJ701_016812 isoform 1-T2 [Geothlypis trichas]
MQRVAKHFERLNRFKRNSKRGIRVYIKRKVFVFSSQALFPGAEAMRSSAGRELRRRGRQWAGDGRPTRGGAWNGRCRQRGPRRCALLSAGLTSPSSAKRSSREASQLCIYGPSAPKPCRALAPAPFLQPAGAACSAAPTAPFPRPGVAAVQRTPPPRPVPLTALLSAVPVRSRPLEREERAAGPQECNGDRPYDGGGDDIGTAWLSRKCAQPPS